jgi:hypothetical protein
MLRTLVSIITLSVQVARATILSLKCALMKHSSFAIWDRNRAIMAISAAIWITNAVFQIIGEFTSSSILCEVNLNECGLNIRSR